MRDQWRCLKLPKLKPSSGSVAVKSSYDHGYPLFRLYRMGIPWPVRQCKAVSLCKNTCFVTHLGGTPDESAGHVTAFPPGKKGRKQPASADSTSHSLTLNQFDSIQFHPRCLVPLLQPDQFLRKIRMCVRGPPQPRWHTARLRVLILSDRGWAPPALHW